MSDETSNQKCPTNVEASETTDSTVDVPAEQTTTEVATEQTSTSSEESRNEEENKEVNNETTAAENKLDEQPQSSESSESSSSSSSSGDNNVENKENENEQEEEVEEEEEEELPVPDGHHKLQCSWTFFYNNKKHGKDSDYKKSLVKLNTFNTVEGFWSAYTHLKRPDELAKDANVYLFRKNCYPMWEHFAKGGCWNLCVAKVPGRLSRLWELLLMGVVGELFEEPDVVGIILSKRSKEDVLSVWNANHQLRLKIGDRFKKILQIPPNTPIDYKYHIKSIKDRSTYRNGRTYIGSLTNPSAKKLQQAAAKQAAQKQAKAKQQQQQQQNAVKSTKNRGKNGNSNKQRNKQNQSKSNKAKPST